MPKLLSVQYLSGVNVRPPVGSGMPGANGASAYQIWLAAGNEGDEGDFLEWLRGDGRSAFEVWLAAGNEGDEADFLEWLRGADGEPGPSAYEVWLALGNQGSEAEFIAFLSGDPGGSAYDVAVANGFEGTVPEWLESLMGDPGDPGPSAYEVALANGFEGTAPEWLESLAGDPGDPGPSAYEVAVAQGFTGSVDEWLESLGGEGAGLPAEGREDGKILGLVPDEQNPGEVKAAWINTSRNLTYRSASYFGIRMNYWDDPVFHDNLAAVADAIEWSNQTRGGKVRFGYGICGMRGTSVLLPYANIAGSGIRATQFRQLQVPMNQAEAEDPATNYQDVFRTPFASEGGGSHLDLSDFHIHGGWDSVNDYEGQVGAVNWEYDPALKTQVGLGLYCPSTGPEHPSGVGQSNADPHHTIQRLLVRNVAGSGIVSGGRGEIFMSRAWVAYAARFGIDWGAPDCWIDAVTAHVCGDSAFRLTAGNQRLSNIKGWFCGMQRSVEPVGAGIHFAGPGIKNVIAVNLSSQDTYGPGMILEGKGLAVSGNIDEPAAGRLEEQGFGFEESGGERNQRRSFLRVDNAEDCEIRLSLSGARSKQTPLLVDFEDSGAKRNDVHLWAEGGTVYAPIRRAGGVINAKRYHRVWVNRQMVLGRVTRAELDDATHGVNEEGVDLVHLDPAGVAFRNADRSWLILDAAPEAGADGREVELQRGETHIQWRYAGDEAWTDLVAVSDLSGPRGERGLGALKFSAPVGDGSASSFDIAHNLGTGFVLAQLRETATGTVFFGEITVVDANTVRVAFADPPAAGQFTLFVLGVAEEAAVA